MARVPEALDSLTLHVESLDAEGRGVARKPEGKVVFVEGALPGEDVEFAVLKKKLSHEFGKATSILHESAARRTPRCPHFGVCGGCATQHADAGTQMAAKQRWLEENLARIGKVRAETMLPIIYGQEWGYRNRARLSARHVPKKGGVLVGFREKRSTYIADMRECPVLPEKVSALIPSLKQLIESLSINDRVPQIEVAVGDNPPAFFFPHLFAPPEKDPLFLNGIFKSSQNPLLLLTRGPASPRP